MRLDIDRDVIDRFARDGFVVVENALDADELETWRNVVGDAVARRLEAHRVVVLRGRPPIEEVDLRLHQRRAVRGGDGVAYGGPGQEGRPERHGEPDPDQPGKVLIQMSYRVRATNDRRNLVFPFYVIPRENAPEVQP